MQSSGGRQTSTLQLGRCPSIDSDIHLDNTASNSSPCNTVTTHSECAWFPAMACCCHRWEAHLRKGKPRVMPRGVGNATVEVPSAERLAGGWHLSTTTHAASVRHGERSNGEEGHRRLVDSSSGRETIYLAWRHACTPHDDCRSRRLEISSLRSRLHPRRDGVRVV